jgi:iron complex outermembrane receptor protein
VDEDGEILPLPFGQPGLCGQYLNVADADVKGAELELQLRPVEGLLIDAAWSYLDFKFGAPYIETGAVVEGQRAPGLGKNKWSVGAQYELRFANGATLTPRADVYHTAGYCGNLACTPLASNPGYELVNARLTYRTAGNDWNVSLEATNVTDKLYDLNKFNSTYASSQPGTPRLWGLSVRRKF